MITFRSFRLLGFESFFGLLQGIGLNDFLRTTGPGTLAEDALYIFGEDHLTAD